MEQTSGGWTVLDRDAGVLVHTYSFAKGALSTTFAARMADGKMMVVSPATGLSEEAAKELEGFGEVGALVANNGFHHLGQAEWRTRFPKARCFAPAAAAARIKKKNPKAGDFEPLSALASLSGPDVGVHEVEKTRAGESWCWAKVNGGYAYYTSDVLANMPELPRFLPIKFLFWATNSGPGYSVFHLALSLIVKDKKGALRALLSDLEARPVRIMVPAHGGILANDDVASETRRLLEGAL